MMLRFEKRSLVYGAAAWFALLGAASSCSLRDTSGLDSQPLAAGQPGAGENNAGATGSQGGAPGVGGVGGEASGGEASGGTAGLSPSAGNGGDAGTDEGGAGGSIEMEPPPLGSFANCPKRTLWTADSNPPMADLQAVATNLKIDPNQMFPQYAIDDADVTGTETRFSSGRIPTGEEYVVVDMGVERWVSGVYTKELSDDYGRQYEVSTSRDGSAYAAVANHEGQTGAFNIAFKPVIARFVRLSEKAVGTTKWWSLHDYKVYCTDDAVPQGGSSGL